MFENKSILGLIPARGGSKGLTGKNIRPLNGSPLIEWTIRAARESKLLDEVMVSTDSADIAKIARDCGANIPFMRPQSLAEDITPTIDVVEHVVDMYKTLFEKNFDYIALLEPTSPIREKNDIDNMITMLISRSGDFDGIVSLGEVKEHPSIVMQVQNDCVKPLLSEEIKPTRRQDMPKIYFPFGVAYIVKKESLMNERTFFCKRTLGYEIKRHQCYEIDDIIDFISVEAIIKYLGDK